MDFIHITRIYMSTRITYVDFTVVFTRLEPDWWLLNRWELFSVHVPALNPFSCIVIPLLESQVSGQKSKHHVNLQHRSTRAVMRVVTVRNNRTV